MKAKGLVIIFFLTLLPVPIAFLTALYLYDPLSIFHMPYNRPLTGLRGNHRIQNISLIKHVDFDSIIIGNSYTANTSAREAGQIFGGKFLNLSMDGAQLYEQSIVLNYVLRTKKIKKVIGVFSEGGYEEKGHNNFPLENWDFLYDDNPNNDIQIYLNNHYLLCLSMWSNATSCVGMTVDIDTPSGWYNSPWHYSRFGGIDKWVQYIDNRQLADSLKKHLPHAAAIPVPPRSGVNPKQAEEIISAIDRYIVKPAQKYPDTHFYYFFNPSSMLGKAVAAREGYIEKHSFWVKQAVLQCAGLKNIKLYFFDNESFVENIANYKDFTHYSKEINSLILQYIRTGYGHITTQNVDEYLDIFELQIRSYDLKAINDYIQQRIDPEKRASS